MRTILRTVLVLLVAGLVIAAAWAMTPSYDPKRAEAEQTKAEAAQAARKIPPAPGSEAALRQAIGEIQRGQPDYARMSKDLSDAVRRQLPKERQLLGSLGPLQSMTHITGGPRGDLYRVKFRNGSLLWGISLGKTGVIESLFYDAGRPPTPQDWIDNYARFGIGERVKRMATQFAILLAAAAFGRYAMRLRL